MRVGVFGGSFDPVHVGHLIVAQAVLERLSLDQVRFVPAGRQPFKEGASGHGSGRPAGASGDDRRAMLAAVIAGDPRFVVDDRELRRPGPSYTVDTLRALHAEDPSAELFFLLGADAARHFGQWREPDAVAALATVVVMTRPGVTVPAHPLLRTVLDVPAVAVSASAIRARRRDGRSIRYLVPRAVADYVTARQLYRHEG